MSETSSGNRWEPGSSGDAYPGPRPEPASTPSAPTGSDVVPVEWAAAAGALERRPSYDVPVTVEDGTRGRRRGLLVAGVALVVLASGATGYVVGGATAGSGQDQVTRQGPPPGLDGGPGGFGPPAAGNGAG